LAGRQRPRQAGEHRGLGKKLKASLRRRFAFVLARSVGVLDVDAMLDAMPAAMFDEWLAAYIVDPWAELRIDLKQSDESIRAAFQAIAERLKKRGRR
jgi:hypothetical protein